jgi:hypothetical protein
MKSGKCSATLPRIEWDRRLTMESHIAITGVNAAHTHTRGMNEIAMLSRYSVLHDFIMMEPSTSCASPNNVQAANMIAHRVPGRLNLASSGRILV